MLKDKEQDSNIFLLKKCHRIISQSKPIKHLPDLCCLGVFQHLSCCMKHLYELSEFSNVPVYSEIILKHIFNKKRWERLWWMGVLEQFEWMKLSVACSFISRGCCLSSESIQWRFLHSFAPL